MRLNDVGVNECGEIVNIKPCKIKRRLMDMGFCKGILVRPVLIGKGIRAYSIKKGIICIRDEDACNIEVRV